MEVEFNHLNHATWECKYHVVFTPKYRKKLLLGKIRCFTILRTARNAGSRRGI
jgi:REP element-mobilizing transposase RayT